MKFLIDAQLPFDLKKVLKDLECDALHVNELPQKDKSTDLEIRLLADEQNRIVVTKDFDFYHTHVAIHSPKKLLLITTGNIKNKALFEIIRNNFKIIQVAFRGCGLVELSNSEVIGIE